MAASEATSQRQLYLLKYRKLKLIVVNSLTAESFNTRFAFAADAFDFLKFFTDNKF